MTREHLIAVIEHLLGYYGLRSGTQYPDTNF